MSVRGSTLAWLGLPLLAVLAYSSALHNPFLYDDILSIQENAFIRRLDLAPLFFHGGVSSVGFANGQFRPLTLVTFALNYWAGGEAPFGYRLVNLALHALNALLAVRILRWLLQRVPFSYRGQPQSETAATGVAFLAAAIFVVHPMNSLAVLLVWKRATLLLTLFSLVAVSSLLALRCEDASRPRGRRVALHIAVWSSQLLALASKESAAILPAMLLLVDLWPRSGWDPCRRWREVAALQIPVLVIGAAGAVFLLSLTPHQVDIGRLAYLATQAKAIWDYVVMAVAPSTVSTVYDLAPARAGDPLVWLGGLSLLAAILVSAWSRKRWPLPTLVVFWAGLALAPTSSLIPIPLLMDEDRTYLAFLPLWILPAHALCRAASLPNPMWRITARTGAAIILLVLTGFTLARGALWSDGEFLWQDAVKKHPGSRLASSNYCAAILGRPERALQAPPVCLRAYEFDPENPRVQAALVTAYTAVGAFDKAEALTATLLRQAQPSPLVYRVAGHLAWFRNRPIEAIAHYRRVLVAQPFDFEAVLYLARSLAELGRLDEARSLARQLDQWPLSTSPPFRLAVAELHRSIEWIPRACAEYRELKPSLGDGTATSTDQQHLAAACERQ